MTFVLMMGILAAYGPTLEFQFILDDHRFVNDPRLQSSGHVWDYFTKYVWAQFPGGPLSFYRPLFVLWLRVNFILNGTSPWGWHLLSIAKHLAVTVLLGLLVWKLLRDRIAVLLAGTLFALHPAQTESVAWVTVPDPLMAAAVLGSLLLYLKYEGSFSAHGQPSERLGGRSRKKLSASDDARPSRAWLAASVVLYLIALLVKEPAIVLPVITFALAWMVTPNQVDRARPELGVADDFAARLVRAFRKTLPFLMAAGAYLLLRISALGRLGARTQHLSWSTLLLSTPATLWFYVKVLLWPVHSRAYADPSQADAFPVHGVVLPALAVGCAVAVLLAALYWARNKARCDLSEEEAARVEQAVLLGTALLVLPILPALDLNGLNPGDYLHGRYTYLPLAGLMLLLATGWQLLKKRRRPIFLGVAVVLVVVSVIFTVAQEKMWRDDLTVFTAAHENAPHNRPVAQSLARAQVQLALDMGASGRCGEALPVFERVSQEYPQDWYAWAGLGDCFVQINDLSRAEQSLRRAAELSHEPRVIQAWQQVRAKMGLPEVLSQ